uniref:Chlorophyll a-b binding protein, chloroplastic n=1 Tax=Pyramimonas obovata TaxID=1411642 RepID=A0A7S0RJT1_9CHLO|eukprot:CAMPEP_0118921646 /NCGR_PEP_ID=MMETSP1169-20130426/855_1 /TAXON_ID=36882 /ORGANISM="Pyramimonas obovata, Strain CCMP722" /LENGTH=289 /DNA_ID=CAMNT_0006862405 /DNA_START=78 /DNA_END=947 /DNA_ORIENTATION=+
MAFAQCLTRASLSRPSVPQSPAASRSTNLKATPARRAQTVVVRAEMDDSDPFDMSAIGLDDIMQLTDDAEMNSRAAWLPGTYAPAYLDGTLPGDFGFDPLGFGKNPEMLAKFKEAELMHARWAMLGVAGSLAVEILGLGNWLDAPLMALNGGVSTYMGKEIPLDLQTLAILEVALMGFAELKRGGASAEERMYPGGAFDPMGMSKGNLEELKLKEIKNGRLAMTAIFGFYMQASVTHTGPVANWVAHISDPWGQNVATNPISIPFGAFTSETGAAEFWAAAVPSWYPGL